MLWRTRQQRLSLRFALGWVALLGVGLLSLPLVAVVAPISRTFELTSSALLTGCVFAVLLGVTIQISVSLSGYEKRTESLAIEAALSGAPELLQRKSTLIVVPAWNEEFNISAVVESLRRHDYEVVVIDDGSTDASAKRARIAGATVLSLPFNLGVGAAIRCGLRYAVAQGASQVVQCDADGQHPAESVAELIRQGETNEADLIVASRFDAGKAPEMQISRHRRLAMLFLAKICSSACNTQLTDSTSGFRLIKEPLLSELSISMPSYYLGDTFETYVAAGRAGYRISEIHTPIRERTSGVSSASLSSSILMLSKALLLTSLRLGIRLPQRPRTDR